MWNCSSSGLLLTKVCWDDKRHQWTHTVCIAVCILGTHTVTLLLELLFLWRNMFIVSIRARASTFVFPHTFAMIHGSLEIIISAKHSYFKLLMRFLFCNDRIRHFLTPAWMCFGHVRVHLYNYTYMMRRTKLEGVAWRSIKSRITFGTEFADQRISKQWV